MSNYQGQYQQHQPPPQQQQQQQGSGGLGATFVPGGSDDYFIPVVSPLPQRSMPEVPGQIQQNLAQLELDAGSQRPPSAPAGTVQPPMAPEHQHQQPPSQSNGYQQQQQQQQEHTPSPHQKQQQHPPPQRSYDEDEPNFSPFPRMRERPMNVPPTDEERESILENARTSVLTSNDAEMQMSWAQDTLIYVDVAVQNEFREAEVGTARPRTPHIEHQLRVDAVNIVSFLADQHHPKAEFLRGMWLEFGKFGFTMDKREAYRCYSRSAQNGYPRSEYRMGMQFESSNEQDKAIKHYNLGVQAGDAAACYRMGMTALIGQLGQHQDIPRGLDLVKYSAEHADENAPQGAYVYGMLLARELPQVTVPEQSLAFNLADARNNIEKAAYLGFAKAQVRMGAAYELSQLGCDFNPVLSMHYNHLAARQGEAEAEMALSKWFLSGYEGVFQKNEALAFSYAHRAARTDLGTAEFAMGYFYEVGIHVPTNLQEARKWYAKAAEHGNKDAGGRIDGISRSKTLSRKDHDKIAMAKLNQARGRSDSVTSPVQPQGQNQGQGYNPTPPQYAMPAIPDNPAGPPAPSAPSAPYPQNDYLPQQGGGLYPGYQQHQQQQQQQQPRPFQGRLQKPIPPRYGNASPGAASAPPQGTGPYTAPGGRPGIPPAGSPLPQGPPGGYGQGGGPPRGYYRGASPGPGRPPQQAQAPYQVGQQQSQYPQGYRISSGPLPRASSALPPQPQQPPAPSRTPGADIGFTAPPDLTGADRRRVPHHGPGSGSSGSGPPGPAHAATFGGGAGGSQGLPSPALGGGRPPRGDSLPAPGMRPVATAASTPPPANLSSHPPPGQQPHGPGAPGGGAAAAAAPARRPGKGPATFEEMGVPVAKKQDDCIIM